MRWYGVLPGKRKDEECSGSWLNSLLFSLAARDEETVIFVTPSRELNANVMPKLIFLFNSVYVVISI